MQGTVCSSKVLACKLLFGSTCRDLGSNPGSSRQYLCFIYIKQICPNNSMMKFHIRVKILTYKLLAMLVLNTKNSRCLWLHSYNGISWMDFDHYKNWNLHKCCDYIPIVRAYKLVMGTLCPQNVMYVIQYRARLCMEKKRSGWHQIYVDIIIFCCMLNYGFWIRPCFATDLSAECCYNWTIV